MFVHWINGKSFYGMCSGLNFFLSWRRRHTQKLKSNKTFVRPYLCYCNYQKESIVVHARQLCEPNLFASDFNRPFHWLAFQRLQHIFIFQLYVFPLLNLVFFFLCLSFCMCCRCAHMRIVALKMRQFSLHDMRSLKRIEEERRKKKKNTNAITKIIRGKSIVSIIKIPFGILLNSMCDACCVSSGFQ